MFVLSDLDLGMNNWMSDPFVYPEEPIRRGKVLSKEKLEELKGQWGRYADVDGDGIPYRTLPGTDHLMASYFTRGSWHDAQARYSERPADYVATVDRLKKKYETAKQYVPKPEIDRKPGAKIGYLAYGSSHLATLESQQQIKDERGIDVSYLRLRALPFTDEVFDFIATHDRVYVIEQNRDGQMADLLRLALAGDALKLRKVLHYDGLPIDARFVTDAVVEAEGC